MAVSAPRARTELRDLLVACRAVEERRKPPFDIDLARARETVAAYFPEWRDLEDLRLDAAVLNGLARVVQIQEARIRYEAGLFLADPHLLADKAASLSPDGLAAAFLASWHPLAELQQVTARGLADAKRYFDALLPWRDRRVPEPKGRLPEPARLEEEDLAAMGVLRREGFLGFLGALWEELRTAEAVEYAAFVDRGDRARRAYGISFLVSYGYAELVTVNGSLVLRANAERVVRRGNRSVVVVLGGAT